MYLHIKSVVYFHLSAYSKSQKIKLVKMDNFILFVFAEMKVHHQWTFDQFQEVTPGYYYEGKIDRRGKGGEKKAILQ